MKALLVVCLVLSFAAFAGANDKCDEADAHCRSTLENCCKAIDSENDSDWSEKVLECQDSYKECMEKNACEPRDTTCIMGG